MSVSDADLQRVSDLLMRDADATSGVTQQAAILDIATGVRAFVDDADDYVQKVVDEVQQYFHDTFIETSWPQCPRHPNHPLWFRHGCWWCERDGVAIAKLGELGAGT